MITRIYTSHWLAVAFAAVLIFFTGNMTATVGVVFGFIVFGLIFMGMMSVLPATIAHPALNELKQQKAPRRRKILARIRSLTSDVTLSDGVEIRNPRFH